jgi:putative ABC transport system permease protein
VTAGFFDALGVTPVLGRLYTTDEAAAGGESVAVISHSLWQRRWGGDRGVLGQTFSAYADDRPDDAEVFTIIGVLPADFWYINRFTEVLAPLRVERPVSIARIAPGLTLADAEQRLIAEARARNPERSEVRLVPVQQALSEQVRPVLVTLSGAVLLVLLLACGNAAVLLIVRAAGREREFALRAAIGAGRRRLVRQLLVEGLTLASLSALVGVLLAWVVLTGFGEVLTRVLNAPVPGGVAALRIDGVALIAAVGASAIAALMFTLIPLFSLSRPNLAATLVEGSRSTDSRKRQRIRSALVAAEVALSLSLLIGAGLLVRSAAHLQQLNPGFDERNLAAIDLSLRQRAYPEPAARVALFERLRAGVERDVPGVRIAFVSWAPFSRLGTVPVETPARPMGDSAAANAFQVAASPEYFEVMGIAAVRGRVFDATHVLGSPPVALVSERLAAQLWPGRDPVGERIRVPANPGMHDAAVPEWRTVIGVVAEVRKTLTEENPPDLYYAWAQEASFHAEMIVRDGTGRGRLREIREAVWRVSPELPLNTVRWIEDDVATASLPSRFLAGLLTSFAAFALALATLALYGVIAYAVMQRRRDIAIRMALGATRNQVIGLFLRWGGAVILAGVAAGTAGGLALSRVLQNQLHGVSPTDAVTYLGVVLILSAAAFLATWLPARRAAHEQPMRVLQSS